mgnify:CR=1 FL=1
MVCRETLESQVTLQCNDNICKKHVSNQTNDVILCEKWRVEHQIPTNIFQPNNVLKEILESELAYLDFYSVYKAAKIHVNRSKRFSTISKYF